MTIDRRSLLRVSNGRIGVEIGHTSDWRFLDPESLVRLLASRDVTFDFK